MINTEYISKKIVERKNKIATYAEKNNMPDFVAAMYVDQNAPLTTNRKMFAQAGFNLDTVTTDNYQDVINAFDAINVTIVTDGSDPERIARVLNTIIDEEVPECWGGPDMREYIDIFPGTEGN